MWSISRCGAIALAFLVLSCGAWAQDYPNRTVTIVVPFAPGGSSDIGARLVATQLAERLGKPVVVENRPGAGTVVGTNSVAKAAPDGYTILMGTSSALAVNPTLFKKLPYDPIKDFVPLALLGSVPFLLVVQPSLDVHSVADLVKFAKGKSLSFATAGVGSPSHLYTEMLKSMTGIEITNIPYKSTAGQVTDFLAGQIPAMFVDLPPTLPLIREGKMRALGFTLDAKVAAAPDIPSLAKAGLPGFNASGWLMFVAPVNTPKEIVERLHNELKTIAAAPEIRAKLIVMGQNPADNPDIESLKQFVASEIERYGKIIRQAGIAGSQ
jgi:tripartite-type tricarboxylate transporter receptor subunit TctC